MSITLLACELRAVVWWFEHSLALPFPGNSAGKESTYNAPQFNSWVGKIPWRRDRLPTTVFLGFLNGSDGKESTCNVGDLGLIPGLGRSPGGGHGNPLQYSIKTNKKYRISMHTLGIVMIIFGSLDGLQVPRYLIKYYLECFVRMFSMRIAFKLAH